MEIETIVYYLVLLDALSANIVAWSGWGKHVLHSSKFFATHLPITRGWAALYILIVLWLGYALSRLGLVSMFWL